MAAFMWGSTKIIYHAFPGIAINMKAKQRVLQSVCVLQNSFTRQMSVKKNKRFVAPPTAKDNTSRKEKVLALKRTKQSSRLKSKAASLPEDFYTRVPTDDVWIQSEYPVKTFSLSEAITMHRECCMPEMFNNPDALVQLTSTVSMKTKKKTKFLKGFADIIMLPHYFTDGTDSRVIAICQSTEEKEQALSMGAVFAGGVDILKSLQKGEIRPYEYDHLICTLDMITDITKIRKTLKDNFPNQRSGTLGTDVEEMMTRFTLGKKYECTNSGDNPSEADFSVYIGRLNMTDEELQANLQGYLRSFSRFKKDTTGKFMLKGAISVVPNSGEQFLLNAEELEVLKEVKDKVKDKAQAVQS